jgi:hypothetical protein
MTRQACTYLFSCPLTVGFAQARQEPQSRYYFVVTTDPSHVNSTDRSCSVTTGPSLEMDLETHSSMDGIGQFSVDMQFRRKLIFR